MKSLHEFDAFEAKNRFGHLLDLVENGEEVTITRHGGEVAAPYSCATAHQPGRRPRSPSAYPRPCGAE
jgi:antitoxin (DNA-binding transcriptional repressor) of toxin-antitoxin stability system